MVTGGASAAAKLGSKGGKVLKYADDVGDLAKKDILKPANVKNKKIDRYFVKGYNITKNSNTKYFLQEKLNFSINGEKGFVPKYTEFKNVKTIAGEGSGESIRDIKRLINEYGGKEKEWQKRAGLVESEKYLFDVHWYELDHVQYEIKLKNRSEIK